MKDSFTAKMPIFWYNL